MTQATTITPLPLTASEGPAATGHSAGRPDAAGPGTGRRLAGFLGWVLTGFGALTMFRRRTGPRFKTEEVVIYCVHRSFFLWPLILTGFVAGGIVHHHPAMAGPLGWVYIWVMLFTLASLLFDMGWLKLMLWSGIFLFAWFLSKYFEELRHFHVLSPVVGHLKQLKPELNAGFAGVMSWLLLGPWIGALFHSFSRGRKTFSPNGIEEWFMGEGREITDRAGLKFRTSYRDVLESVMALGGGDLLAIDSTGQVCKRWENVLFLTFVWRRLDEILQQRAAVVENAADDPVEVNEVKAR